MTILFKYYRSNPDAKILVIPHPWATNVVVLLVYRATKFLFFRRWKLVDSEGIDWPHCRGDLDRKVFDMFFKNQS